MNPHVKTAHQKCGPKPWLDPSETPTLLSLLGRDERDAQQLKEQAQRIVELRKLRMETQEDVWTALDVHYRTYQNWEAGAVEIRPANLRKLAEHFETTPDYLRFGRNRGKHETPDISATLNIGAEILTRLISIESKVDDLLERRETAARRLAQVAPEEAEDAVEFLRELRALAAQAGRDVGRRDAPVRRAKDRLQERSRAAS